MMCAMFWDVVVDVIRVVLVVAVVFGSTLLAYFKRREAEREQLKFLVSAHTRTGNTIATHYETVSTLSPSIRSDFPED
jgi:RsiW-degrading membrane proteinase PrsW (M82 family)